MLQKSQLIHQKKHSAQLPNTQFQIIDSSKLPFKDDTFDTCIDTFGLCSCDDPLATIKEMQRVTKKGGFQVTHF